MPTQLLNSPIVWKVSGDSCENNKINCIKNTVISQALLEKMPMTAMIRNLNKMTAIGLIGEPSPKEEKVEKKKKKKGEETKRQWKKRKLPWVRR